jgi:hypothetical protein
MPVDTELCSNVWYRYQFVRDNGHQDYVDKAEKCDKFFQGLQWDPNDMALLKAQRRPALTINKIISTLSNVMGEQIQTRNDIHFMPRSGANPQTAEVLTKLMRQISDNNQLDWKRSDMFADGIITSRGYLDVRLDFDDQMQGEVTIENLNPKNVLVDPDADSYDPDDWNDIFVTKWMTWQDIEILYGKENAELLKNRENSFFPYGYDSIERNRDRFGFYYNRGYYIGPWDQSMVMRNIRVIERQYRKLDNQLHFVELATGDMRPVPDGWDRDRIAAVCAQYGLSTTKKLVKRVRWTVIADNVRLYDDWSPYKHFTVVPYFPYFRRGSTVGLVENLLGPQEYLNKISSQELHVVNTTANSGWKVKTGSLKNMTIEELEQRGAETGLVLEVDDPDSLEKIQPNQTPQGLDRLSYKAEEHIKTISGISDYQTGQAREDVSAKAVQLNQSRGMVNLAKPMDNLQRTDFILARNILDMVQEYYTEPRILNVTHNRLTGESEELMINQPTPEGDILNDLTLGEYDVVVSSTPHRETLEDSQFEQALALREMGLPIPDDILIENSRLNRRGEIIKKMQDAANSPEQQEQAALQMESQRLAVEQLRSEVEAKRADAQKKKAEGAAKAVEAEQAAANGGVDPGEMQKMQMEMEMEREKHALEMQKMQMELEFKERELQLKQREYDMKLQAQAQTQAMKVEAQRDQLAHDQAANQIDLAKQAAEPSQGDKGNDY